MTSVFFCCVLFGLSAVLTATALARDRKAGILLLCAMIPETAGLLFHIYQRGTYCLAAWNIVSAAYHIGQPYSIPKFFDACLMAINPHSPAFSFSESDSGLLFIFGRATNLWETASLCNSLTTLALYLLLLSAARFAWLRKFILPILCGAPLSIAGAMTLALARCSALFIGYSARMLIVSCLLNVYPLAFYLCGRPPAHEKNQTSSP